MRYNKKIIEDIIKDGVWLSGDDHNYDVHLGYHPDDFEKYFKGTPFRSYDFDDVNFDNKIFKLSEIGFTLVKSINDQMIFCDYLNKIVITATTPSKLDLELFKFSPNEHTKSLEISFYHHENNKQKVEEILHYLFKNIFKKTEKENNFYMIAQSSEGLYNQRAAFKPMPIKDDRFDLYYGKSFPYEKFVEFMNDETDHLLLIHGDSGAGKSNFIKHLIKNSGRDVIYIPPSMLSVISQPSFVSYMLENRGSILLIEDGEEILSADRNAATQNLLGMTSGFLKDSMDLKVIATFNIDIGKLDSALLRKGRLHFEYKFGKLSKEEGQELVDYLKIDIKIDRDMTLAEIFNQKPTSIENSFESRKIGFLQ